MILRLFLDGFFWYGGRYRDYIMVFVGSIRIWKHSSKDDSSIFPGRHNYHLQSLLRRDKKTISSDRYLLNDCALVDYFYFDWIRKLGNISTAFRKELGEVFWSRTDVHIGSAHDENGAWSFLDFLSARPAIHRGIRSLGLSMSISSWTRHEENPGPCAIKSPEAFEHWCDIIAKCLVLKEFSLYLWVDESKAKELAMGDGVFASLKAFRKLRVNEVFSFLTTLMSVEDEGRYYSTIYFPIDEHTRYEAAIRELMLPDTLRGTQKFADLEG